MQVIDLRSDTVTQPTPDMRRAMAAAEVGDDVFGEDPTIARLEAAAAARMGKKAAVFMASGTMSNLVAALSFCGRGDEMLLGSESHILHHEVGGVAALGGIHPREVPNDPRGRLAPEDVRARIRPTNVHMPRTALLCLEDTHNRCGGAALPPAEIAAVARIAHAAGVPVYLDGARIFNACEALAIEPGEITRHVDAVAFCLSKGLASPVGSLLCGPIDFITRARKARKMVGGGMRQAGVLAAAGLVALETMVGRLADDHACARRLAAGLSDLTGLEIDPATVETNIVMVGVAGGDAAGLRLLLQEQGVLVSQPSSPRLRFVTHCGIDQRDVDEALDRIRRVMDGLGRVA